MDFSVNRLDGAVSVVLNTEGHNVQLMVQGGVDERPDVGFVTVFDEDCGSIFQMAMSYRELCNLSAVLSRVLGEKIPDMLMEALDRVTESAKHES